MATEAEFLPAINVIYVAFHPFRPCHRPAICPRRAHSLRAVVRPVRQMVLCTMYKFRTPDTVSNFPGPLSVHFPPRNNPTLTFAFFSSLLSSCLQPPNAYRFQKPGVIWRLQLSSCIVYTIHGMHMHTVSPIPPYQPVAACLLHGIYILLCRIGCYF